MSAQQESTGCYGIGYTLARVDCALTRADGDVSLRPGERPCPR